MRKCLISHAKVVDVDRDFVMDDQNIEIDGRTIASVSMSRPVSDALEIDDSGCYVCPGLIDAHVHLFLNAGAQPRIAFFESSEEEKLRTREPHSLRTEPRHLVEVIEWQMYWFDRHAVGNANAVKPNAER